MAKGVIFRDGKTGKAVRMDRDEFMRYMRALWEVAQLRKAEREEREKEGEDE